MGPKPAANKVEAATADSLAAKGDLGGLDLESVKTFIKRLSPNEIEGLVAAARQSSAKPLILADGKSGEAIILAVRMSWNGPWGVQKKTPGPPGQPSLPTVQEMVAKPTGEKDEDGNLKYHISNASWKAFVRGVALALTEANPTWGDDAYYKALCLTKYGYHWAKPWPLNRFDDLPNDKAKIEYVKRLKGKMDETDSSGGESSGDEDSADEVDMRGGRGRGRDGKGKGGKKDKGKGRHASKSVERKKDDEKKEGES